MIPLVYSPNYNITAFGLEKLHPFDGLKYRRLHDWLIQQGLRKPEDFTRPRPVSLALLRHVHTDAYLQSLNKCGVLAGILEVLSLTFVPACFTYWRVLRPMRWATGGTILAARLAVEHGLAINLGGGYHHAGANKGGGFCVYADGPLALKILFDEKRVTSAMVVDTDAHQGNGTADLIRAWPWAHILDLFQKNIFPPKVEEDMPVPLQGGTCGGEYMDLLRKNLPAAFDRYRPNFVLYNAGSDVLQTDPLAGLKLTPTDLAERDLYVVSEARERGIPLAMVLSGGYGRFSWEAHARSIEGILARFDRGNL